MPQIIQQGTINTAALIVPDLYVQIVPPQTINLNGVPTNVLGVVGTASWGPVNMASTFSGMPDYQPLFGKPVARKYDMGTQVATSYLQGASNYRGVRVTDGTDLAASAALASTFGTATSIYTGSAANGDTLTYSAGSKAGTAKVVIGRAGLVPEVFDNLTPTAAAVAAAINAGTGVLRGKSALIVFTAGVGSAPSLSAPTTITLSGGADGATTITTAVLIGQDAAIRTGMYALRGQGCSVGLLADADDTTQYTVQDAFGLAEGVYMILTGPSGDTIANAIATKQTAGLDSYGSKLMFGDWLYWNDPGNGIIRLVSPQGFAAGRLANLSPEQSPLNKILAGVVGSQKSGGPAAGTFGKYSGAELQQMFSAGIDVIANPQPGGAYWGVRCGHNSSSNPATNGDNYTRMTNFLAATLATGMGIYVGRTINVDLFNAVKSTLCSFLQNLLQQKILGSTDGSLPFSAICDITNNPDSRTSLGYLQADVQVKYQAINEKFIVNLQGGQTVVVAQAAGQRFTASASA